MALKDLFKSEDERKREERQKRRRAFRDAEKLVDKLSVTSETLKKERDKAWKDAREQLAGGNKFAAKSSLKEAHQCEVLAAKTQTKKFVCRTMLLELDNAQTDKDFQLVFGNLAKVLDIDPDQTEDVMDSVQEKLSDSRDGQKLWDKIAQKQGEEEQAIGLDIPSLEDMEKQLNEEVAASIGGKAGRAEKETESDLKDRIGAGRQRLKNLMEKDK